MNDGPCDYLKAVDPDSNDIFGCSVGVSGDGTTLAVGAQWEDSTADPNDNTAFESGAVFVFERHGTSWLPQRYVKASIIDAGDELGRDVALSRDGSTLVASASGEDSAAVGIDGDQADHSAANSGAVYVFRHDSGGSVE